MSTIGKYFYEVDASNNKVDIYSFSISGDLNYIQSVSTGIAPQYLLIVTINSNNFCYVSNNDDNTISLYSVNDSGILIPLNPATISAIAILYMNYININDNYYLYASSGGNQIFMYSIDKNTGQLTALNTASINIDSGPTIPVFLNFNGNYYAYIVSINEGTINMYSINNTTGQLTALNPANISSGQNPAYLNFITINNNTYLYVPNIHDNLITMYSVNQSNGQLIPLNTPSISTGNLPIFLKIININNINYVYCLNNRENTISVYSINSVNGQLNALSSLTISTSTMPGWCVTTYVNNVLYMYVITGYDVEYGFYANNSGIDIFSVSNNGALTLVKSINQNQTKIVMSYIYEKQNNIRIPCFKEGSKILTNNGYKKIEELKIGDLVKTTLNGYKPIYMIGKKDLYHAKSNKRIKNQLYKCSQDKYPEVFEDLILTGCHSILVENSTSVINEEQIEQVKEVNNGIF